VNPLIKSLETSGKLRWAGHEYPYPRQLSCRLGTGCKWPSCGPAEMYGELAPSHVTSLRTRFVQLSKA
jgi:hypothetical protein